MSRPAFYFYDRQGQPLDIPTADRQLGDRKYRCVRLTDITSSNGVAARIRVSTVWLAVNYGLTDPPTLFETQVFTAGTEDEEHQPTALAACEPVRYATEEQAIAGHADIVTSQAAAVPGPVLTEHEEWPPW